MSDQQKYELINASEEELNVSQVDKNESAASGQLDDEAILREFGGSDKAQHESDVDAKKVVKEEAQEQEQEQDQNQESEKDSEKDTEKDTEQNGNDSDNDSIMSGEMRDATDIDAPRMNPEDLKQFMDQVMTLPPEERASFMMNLIGKNDINPKQKEFSTASRKERIRTRLRNKLRQKKLAKAPIMNGVLDDRIKQILAEEDSDAETTTTQKEETSAPVPTVGKNLEKNRKKRQRKKAAKMRRRMSQLESQIQDSSEDSPKEPSPEVSSEVSVDK